jgi:hypothetical protein
MKSHKKRNRIPTCVKVKPAQENLIVRRVCTILGMIFAVSGFVFITIGNLSTGGLLTVLGLIFIALALLFNHIKVRTPLLEIEAKQDR